VGPFQAGRLHRLFYGQLEIEVEAAGHGPGGQRDDPPHTGSLGGVDDLGRGSRLGEQVQAVDPGQRRLQGRRFEQVTLDHLDAGREGRGRRVPGQRAYRRPGGDQLRDHLAAHVARRSRNQDRHDTPLWMGTLYA
jgi:hypothetical protein